MALWELGASEQLRRMDAGELAAEELTQAYLDRIEQVDGRVGAFLSVDAETALATARDIDRRRAAGEALGLLAGVPIAVKDLLCTRDQITTCGSRMLENFRPPYDATVVSRLREADAVLIGKTNLDEFAMGGSTESSALGETRNPWDLQRVPGGSSGGAAACVSADCVPLSLGSDTGGSVRQPAAFCGVTGLKPTYGRVSRFGLVAFASSLDQIGPVTRTAADSARLLQVIAGHDRRDSTSADLPVPDYQRQMTEPIDGMTIGLLRSQMQDGVDPEILSALETTVAELTRRGVHFVDIELPHAKYGVATYYVIAPCEASSNLARYDGVHYGFRAESDAAATGEGTRSDGGSGHNSGGGSDADDSRLVDMYCQTRSEGFGTEVKRRIMLGTYALSHGYYDAYYLRALRVRRRIRQDYDRAFQDVDLLLGPVTPTPPFRIGEKKDDPLSMYLGDLFTVTTNLAGLPGISIPCGMTSAGLPIGCHLQGPPFAEGRLLQVAHYFQQETDWHLRRPALA